MTTEEFVKKLPQRNINISTHSFNSPKNIAIGELHKALANFLHDKSTLNRDAVEGAINLCGSIGVMTSKEARQRTRELHEIK